MKYELIHDNGKDKPELLKESDEMSKIIFSIIYNTTILEPHKNGRNLHIWMDERLLK